MALDRTINPQVTVIGGANIGIAARHASALYHLPAIDHIRHVTDGMSLKTITALVEITPALPPRSLLR